MVDDITLDIATPKGVFEQSFPMTTKVADVINAVVTAQDLPGGDVYELVFNGAVLQPVERPLVSFGLEGTVALELTATGSGV